MMLDFGSEQSLANETGHESEEPITPELVRKVTEKVYKLLLKDLQTENERRQGRQFR